MKEGKGIGKPELIKRVAKVRVSKRTYEPKICPYTGKEFIPTDKRQIYSSPQAQINHNNDQRAIKQKAFNDFTFKLKCNREALKKVHDKMIELKQNSVAKDLLIFAELDFSIYSSQQINSTTGKPVYWSVDYGIEGLDNENKTFIIHKRKK